MLLAEDDDSWVAKRIGNVRCPVIRPIVDDNHLPILHGLGQNTTDAHADELRVLIGGRQNGYFRHYRRYQIFTTDASLLVTANNPEHDSTRSDSTWLSSRNGLALS
jgi:hypothetical protein